MTTCPSGVDYMHLADLARERIAATGPRTTLDKLTRRVIAATVPHPRRFRAALLGARLGRPFARLFKRAGMAPVAAMLELAPKRWQRRAKVRFAGTAPRETTRPRRVLLLAGCAQTVLSPEINDATVRLLDRIGVDVGAPEAAGCCGALVLHMGDHATARDAARRNIVAWENAISEGPVEAILINTSGCGTTVKDYGHLLARDEHFAERSKRIGAMTKDISEYLARQDLGPPKRWSSLRVAYHAACSLQHGQSVTREPSELLTRAGYAVIAIPEGHICCGSAGTYNMLQPELSGMLRARKVANIERTKPDVVATGNIGCITQLQLGTDIPVVHTVELLDWAYGGPVPAGLEHLADRMSDVPDGGMAGIAMAKALQAGTTKPPA
jgi:glycolate oxidase iron-sulfur subunit